EVLRNHGSKPNKPRGASWNKEKRKWQSKIKIEDRTMHLGWFVSKEEAQSAYFEKFKEAYGYEPWEISDNEVEEVRPVLTPDRIEKRQNGRRYKDVDEDMFTITSKDRHGIAIKEATKKGYAVANEGDSVNVQFPDSKTRRGRVGKQIANTLEASSINQGVVESPPKYRIRKLTPLECWRLQGFTDEAHEAVKQAGLSDSQRYKQA